MDAPDVESHMESVFYTFTFPQIMSVVGEVVKLSRHDKRSKTRFFATLDSLSDELKTRIRQLAANRIGTKRKARDSAVVPRKRMRIDSEDAMDVDEDLLSGPFMRAPTEDTLKNSVVRMIDRTGNDALTKALCMVCARRLFMNELETMRVEDIPNGRNLIPARPHPAHKLVGRWLLHEDAVSENTTFICLECKRKLVLDELPRLALANGMWIGKTPFELLILTLPERLLIALYFPAAYIVKLFPKTKGAQFWDRNTMNSGMKGNVSTYSLNTARIAGIVSGKTMPPPPQILAATIGVTFVGAGNKPLSVFPDFLRVRRQRVFHALLWLKQNNELYSDVDISEEHLRMLPVDGVPDEIRLHAKNSDDVASLEREQAGYVPVDAADEEAETGVTMGSLGLPREGPSEEEGEVGNYSADVFPLQAHGVIDVHADSVPDSELFAHGLSNVASGPGIVQKDFLIRKSSAFINEYPRLDADGQRSDGGTGNANHMLGAFPVLFPYGRGGLEVDREVVVPYEAHVRWALQYADGRFRKDLFFIFQAFGVIQKRQVCRSAGLQIRRSTFIANRVSFLKLRANDFIAASAEENRRVPFSNPVIRSLRKQLTSIRARVPGTDESRMAIRGQIWGMNLRFNPPSIWATLNLADTSDPIAQVLSGQDIDLDRFVATAGPDRSARAANIAGDPFAAAEFFHFMVKAILEEMFGITVNHRGKMKRGPGIVGVVNGYIGTVEAQARGTLHLHILFWLGGAPTAEAMRVALQSDAFRAKVSLFLKETIRADIKGTTAEMVLQMEKKSAVAYSRPVDPRLPNYELRRHDAEATLARAVQVHKCTVHACLRTKGGRLVCKRRAPWQLAVDDWIMPTGEWGPRRVFGNMNAWNPPLLQVTRSNQDMKIITNGHDTKDITFYITMYIAKKQNQAANASALLAKSPAFQKDASAAMRNGRDINLRMIQQCANTLSRQQELSGSEVVSYLMGWGDRFISHNFSHIYWDEVTGALRRVFPGLEKQSVLRRTAEQLGVSVPAEGREHPHDPVVRLTVLEGQFVLKDQLKEYCDRGRALEDMNYYDFHVDTYDGAPLKKKNHDSSQSADEEEVDDENVEEELPRSGRPRSQRVPYLASSKRKGCRVIRGSNLETMPHFIGTWFPRKETGEYYYANILALLKPWRDLRDLVGADGKFESAFESFVSEGSPKLQRIIQNINYFHECSDGARRREVIPLAEVTGGLDLHDDIRRAMDQEDLEELEALQRPNLTEADVDVARNERYASREYLYGMGAMNVAYSQGIFDPDLLATSSGPLCEQATMEDTVKYAKWGEKLAAMTKKSQLITDNTVNIPRIEADVVTAPAAAYSAGVVVVEETPIVQLRTKEQQDAVDILNTEQRRAHDIIEQHLRRTLDGVQQDQLLMMVRGEGGTGKTVLLNAIAQTFDFLQAKDKLAKTATTGVAASLVGGLTVHGWAAIPVVNAGDSPDWTDKASSVNVERRKRNILPARYVNVDECSMLTKQLLAQLSQVVAQVRAQAGEGDDTKPFRGMNVVLFGDFHQFPPVGDPSGALYSQKNKRTQSEIGMAIYQQFTTVVTLIEQKRIVDVEWKELLQRLRIGACTEADILTLHGLRVSDTQCHHPDWNTPPWNAAVLVTPRHAARVRWNTAALMRHCQQTGNRMYITQAEDTMGRDETGLSLEQRVVVAGMPTKKTGKLADRVELAVGMRAMVLVNIATEADLANGTRGEVVDIKLDPREPLEHAIDPETGATMLKYPPVVILFKPDSSTFPAFEGLPKGILPIVPSKMGFTIKSESGGSCRIHRRQLAMTAAYAFTDYKSQGQSLGCVYVDLAKPPSGKLTPFSAYVALSRSSGRDSIRLLRDFDVNLFTTHPSEELAAEDRRLEGLTLETKRLYPQSRT